MRRSLGLAAYRTLSGRLQKSAPYKPAHPRPSGELVWLHAADPKSQGTLDDLAHRLIVTRPDCNILLTGSSATDVEQSEQMILRETIPPDHPVATNAFVAHWRPNVLVWPWGGLAPNLILSAAEHGTFLMFIDAAEDGLEASYRNWLPEVPRAVLEQFDYITAQNHKAQRKLAQMCRSLDKVDVVEPLHPFGQVLSANESDLTELTETLRGRPVWLSARTSPKEHQIVLAAHKASLKAWHRMLLILHAADEQHARSAERFSQDMGLRVAMWSDGVFPDDNTQVLIAADDDELGLWLRIASLTFLGGSLYAGHQICDPYSLAAHGTAIIYGPNVQEYQARLSDLMNVGAAVIVNDSASLGRAVNQFIAPDRTADMAMAGWNVVTRGADSLERVISTIQNRLDLQKATAQ